MELYGRGYPKYQNAKNNTKFQRLNLFPSSDKILGRHVLFLLWWATRIFFGLTGPVGCLHLVIQEHRYCFRCAVFTFCIFGSPDGGQSPQGLYSKSANKSHTTCNELAPMYQGQVRRGSETACGSKLHVFPARSICQSGLIHSVLVRSSWHCVCRQWRNEVCAFTATARLQRHNGI